MPQNVLAKIVAVGLVTLAVIIPGSYVYNVAIKRGGVSKTFAILVLGAMAMLVVWLFLPGSPGTLDEDHLEQFVGAWGILFILVGVVVIVALAVDKFRASAQSDEEKDGK